MVMENITDIVALETLFSKISLLTTIFQAIGGLILVYIIFHVINMVINEKRKKQIEEMSKDVKEIRKLLEIRGRYKKNKKKK